MTIKVIGSFLGVCSCVYLGYLVISRKLRSPEKSLLNSFLNVLFIPLRILKLGPFHGGEGAVRDIHTILKIASKKTGLTDCGDINFVEDYNAILTSTSHKELRFSNLGYIGAQIEMELGFARRYKLIQYLKDFPDVFNVPVRSPVFVMGLPRTGTTFMHRLLSLDPATRSPIMWELINTVPNIGSDASIKQQLTDRFQRSEEIRLMLNQRKSIGDDALKHIHEIEYNLPEECLLGLLDELPIQPHLLGDIYLNMNKYKTFQAQNGYKYYKQILQLLSHQIGDRTEPKRWTLKCPIHIFHTKEIAKIFPDAKLVWTHRHPVSAIPSMCSLITALDTVYYEPDSVNHASIGRAVCDVSGDALEQTPKDIIESGLPCADVVYASLIKDPLGTVKSIYKSFGWEVSAEYEQNILAYLEQNKKEREAVKAERNANAEVLHSYTPEEYHLTTKELKEGKFATYAAKYNIPLDKNAN